MVVDVDDISGAAVVILQILEVLIQSSQHGGAVGMALIVKDNRVIHGRMDIVEVVTEMIDHLLM
jgi:hypothetical protein